MILKRVFAVSVLFFLSAFFSANIFSQEKFSAENSYSDSGKPEQLVIPKDAFVGDTVQLQLTFIEQIDLFALGNKAGGNQNEKSFSETEKIVLDSTIPQLKSFTEICTVKDFTLSRNGVSYVMLLVFVPWKTGVIKIPSFDLQDSILGSEYLEKNPEVLQEDIFLISFENIRIESMAENLGEASLRLPGAPIVLPGTHYVLWTFICLLVLLMIFIAVFLVKFQKIVRKINLWRSEFLFIKNKILTKISLRYLLKEKITDVEFCVQWQKIMRRYLKSRFEVDFSAVAAGRIMNSLNEIASENSSVEIEEALISLVQLFKRTDYIKFARGSIDSRLLPASEHETVLGKNERKSIVKSTDSLIQKIELKINKDEKDIQEVSAEEIVEVKND